MAPRTKGPWRSPPINSAVISLLTPGPAPHLAWLKLQGLSLGQGESAGRLGSVDFAVLLPERDRSGAQRWLADLQARVDACETLRAAGLSVSQGLANAWPMTRAMTRPTSYSCAPTRP
jgi:hypothetical protein